MGSQMENRGVIRRRRAGCTLGLSLALAACIAGCINGGDKSADLIQAVADRDREIDSLHRKIKSLDDALADRDRQIEQLQRLGAGRLEKLFVVTRIRLGRHTGGYGSDPLRHEGIKVYLEPIDGDGSVVKAAGEVTIQLFDLTAGAGDTRLGAYEFALDDIGKYWYGGAFTNRYVFECPWGDRRPAQPEITVRAGFVDALTGKTFTAQTVCTVNLPPAETDQ